MAQEVGKHGGDWHRLYTGVEKVNAVPAGKPLSHYEMACGLLVPLYVPRATEEVLFGAMGVTLQTAREVKPLPLRFSLRIFVLSLCARMLFVFPFSPVLHFPWFL